MSRPYRKARGTSWIWLLSVFSGIGVSIAMAPFLPESLGGWLLVLVSLPTLVGIGAAAFIDSRLTRRRIRSIGAALQSLGLEFIDRPSNDAKAAFFEIISHLEKNAGLRDGAANLQWIAYGPIGGRQALIFEHMFVTGSGRYTQIHIATAVCWVSNDGWLTLIRPRIGETRWYERVHPEIHIWDERFDKDWIIWGEEAVAQAVLTDAFRSGLANSPRGEMWCIGGGFTCCLYRNPMDAANLFKFIQRSGNLLFMKAA